MSMRDWKTQKSAVEDLLLKYTKKGIVSSVEPSARKIITRHAISPIKGLHL